MINPINFTKIQKMALAWFLSFLVLFTLAKGKIPVYILPAFPSMAVITSFLFFKIALSSAPPLSAFAPFKIAMINFCLDIIFR